MTDVATALYEFFSGFGIPAFVEYNVPEEVSPPYITYELLQPDWGVNQALRARVWYRDTSFERISSKVKQMRLAIGNGISIKLDDGVMYLWADSYWAQNQPIDDEPNMKCVYLSMVIQVESY